MAGQGDKVVVQVNEYKGLVDKSLDVNNFVNANINHLLENEELVPMVALYFEYITKTLNLFKMSKFTVEFVTQFASICKEQDMLLVKIRELGVVLEKKHQRAKIGRRVAISLIGTVFFPVIVLMAIASPLSFEQVGNAEEKSIRSSSEKLAAMLKKYENSEEAQIDLCMLIENSTKYNIGEMRKIKERLLATIEDI